jgi:hypothetical protein
MMTKEKELIVFAQLRAHNQSFMDWLEHEKGIAVSALVMSRDPVALHQAQGKVQLIEHMLDLLSNAYKHVR